MDKYQFTQQRIDSGTWRVDGEAGVIIGSRGPMGCVNPDGYVVLTVRPDGTIPRTVLAHRVIWRHAHGPIADGLQINHINGAKTDNRLSNLELATPEENIRHAWRTGLSSAVKGEAAHRAKLTSIEVDQIRRLVAAGATQSSVADDFGVSQGQVSRIANGKQWAA